MAVVINGTTGITTPTESVATTIGVGGATPSASGAGITFPATQSASSNANTLDDYEEGTWTPTLITNGGGSIAVTVLDASYTKIGRLVQVQIDIYTTASSFTGSAGTVQIGAFPFVTIGANARYSNLCQYQDAFNVPNGLVVCALSGNGQLGKAELVTSSAQSATTTFAAGVNSSTYVGGVSKYIQVNVVYEAA